MRLWRVFPWDPAAGSGAEGHALHVPREAQGGGRHDNPDLYGALYLSETAVPAVAEAIAHLRGQDIEDADLRRGPWPLALVPLEARVAGALWDLDDPPVLARHRLRPSQVATRDRAVTRAWAAALYRARPRMAGLRWWSIIESSWMHVTLFDRALRRVALLSAPEALGIAHPAVREAAETLGIRA